MGFAAILIIILWGILSTIAFLGYFPEMKGLSARDFAACCLVFLIGGPIFGLNQIFMAILDCILPEGWDDNDNYTNRR